MTSSKPRHSLSLVEQLALLEDPAPTDFDPEAPEREYQQSEADGSADEEVEEDLGRAHYVAVGKSKLRKAKPLLLDPKYDGARVSRRQLQESTTSGEEDSDADGSQESEGSEDDDDAESAEIESGGEIPSDEDDEIESVDALGSDEERFSGFRFSGSSTTPGGVKPRRGMKVGDDSSGGGSATDLSDGMEASGESEGEGDEGTDQVDGQPDHGEEDEGDEMVDEVDREAEAKRREELRKLIVEEQKTVVTNISKAVKADTEKGTAVKLQQKTFDSLLGARIKLQKAIVATNSLPVPSDPPPPPQPISETYEAAESAARALWNTLTDIRLNLLSPPAPTSLKRKRDPPADSDTPISAMWSKMQKLESDTHPSRFSTLEKWSAKTSSISTSSLARKLNNTAHRGLTATLNETLTTDLHRHVQKTRVPRSCAPGKVGGGEDTEVYDDSDFYQMLLKALVDQRMVDNATLGGGGGGAIRWTTALRDAKVKKAVDTKASKGRKLKYQVQEKIQNFMAPVANNTWHERQIDELFSSLLGQRVRVDEQSEDEDEDEVELDGLRLFRS